MDGKLCISLYEFISQHNMCGLGGIRKKYLKLSKDHHPDLLMSKGVPKEVIEESKKKMRTINSAWDQIQKLKSS